MLVVVHQAKVFVFVCIDDISTSNRALRSVHLLSLTVSVEMLPILVAGLQFIPQRGLRVRRVRAQEWRVPPHPKAHYINKRAT